MNSTRTDVVNPAQTFVGLTSEEVRYLLRWQADARSVGIDAVEDLASRSWPCSIDGAVIGVFANGSPAATWMVVRHNGEWAVATCGDLSVSAPVASLAEALDKLHPAGRRLRDRE